jgi:hypothetical protein
MTVQKGISATVQKNFQLQWADRVRQEMLDLIASGFEDVTEEVELYPGLEEKCVFRGPDGVLYHCWSALEVLNIRTEREVVAGMMASGSKDTHFYRAADGAYHCDVRSRPLHWFVCGTCGSWVLQSDPLA